MLHIADGLDLPLEAVTQTFAILAKRGVGKTYLGLVLAEEMLKVGAQVIIGDPVGVTWGLRSSRNGKADGLPIMVAGGTHGDIGLFTDSGALVAETLVAEKVSCILDLSLFRKGEQVRWMADFSEALYRLNRSPVHLILDEADAFAPQRPMRGQERMLGAVEDLVRRGRARGIGVTLITQRAAVLNKDVLTQIEVLVTLRTISPQDRAAIDEWVKVHGTQEQRSELMASLPSLPIGEAWFWSPGWLDLFQRVKVRQRETFDSSATPDFQGKVKPTIPTMLSLDLERIKGILERSTAPPNIRKVSEPKVERVIELVEVPVLSDDDRALLRQWLERFDAGIRANADAAELIAARLLVDASRDNISQNRTKTSERPAFNPIEGTAFPRVKARILSALARHGTTPKPKLAVLTGYAVSGGGFNNALSSLRTMGLIERGDPVVITESGHQAINAGGVEPLPAGWELVEWWCKELPKAERTILRYLANRYPDSLSKDDVGTGTGYAANGGGFNNALSRLRTLQLIEGRSELQAAEALFS